MTKCKGLIFVLCCFLSLKAPAFQETDSLEQVALHHEDVEIRLSASKQLFAKNLYSKPEVARKFAHLYVTQAAQNKLPSNQSEGLKLVGITYDLQAQVDSALYYYERSMDIAQENSDSLSMAMILHNIAFTQYKQGNYELAMTNYYESLTIKEYLFNTGATDRKSLQMGGTIENIGIVYAKRNDDEKAYTNYLLARNEYMANDDFTALARVYNNIASYHQKQDNPDSAMHYYQLALDRYVNTNNNYGKSIIFNNIAKVQYKFYSNYDSAVYYYKQSLVIREAMNDKRGVAFIKINMAKPLSDLGKYAQAIHSVEEGMKVALELEMKAELLDAYRIMSEVLGAKGDFKGAYQQHQKYHDLQMELLSSEKEKNIEELSAKYETTKKEREIISLQLANQEATIQTNAQRNQRNVFMLTTIIFLVLGGSVFYQYKRNQKTNKLLFEKNTIIEKALEEKNLLMREIHHRVKNNLQVITSLLNMQTYFIEDVKATAAVQDSRNRVHAMSLIHQSLYSQEEVTEVNINDYLQQLCANLANGFNTEEKEIELTTEIDDLAVDVDTAIPMGLIVNELVTNAYKHAFEGRSEGEIKVAFALKEQQYQLSIADNGKGTEGKPMERKGSLGMRLLKDLGKKLKAEIAVLDTNGTQIVLTFPIKAI